MTKLTKNEKAVVRSYIEALQIDVKQMAQSDSLYGRSTLADAALKRLANLDKYFEISDIVLPNTVTSEKVARAHRTLRLAAENLTTQRGYSRNATQIKRAETRFYNASEALTQAEYEESNN